MQDPVAKEFYYKRFEEIIKIDRGSIEGYDEFIKQMTELENWRIEVTRREIYSDSVNVKSMIDDMKERYNNSRR